MEHIPQRSPASKDGAPGLVFSNLPCSFLEMGGGAVVSRLFADRHTDPLANEILSGLVHIHDELGSVLMRPLSSLVFDGKTRSPSDFLDIIFEMARKQEQK